MSRPRSFFHEWKSFATAIEQDLEPPSDGMWGRQVMEILFAAERSSISVPRGGAGQWAGLDQPAHRFTDHH